MKTHGFVCFSCRKVVVMGCSVFFFGWEIRWSSKALTHFFFEIFAQKVGMLPTRNDFRGSNPQKTETFLTEHVDLAWSQEIQAVSPFHPENLDHFSLFNIEHGAVFTVFWLATLATAQVVQEQTHWMQHLELLKQSFDRLEEAHEESVWQMRLG